MRMSIVQVNMIGKNHGCERNRHHEMFSMIDLDDAPSLKDK